VKGASVYARLGWRVIPLEPGGKRPLLKDWPNQASADLEQIEEWESLYPGANLGAVCGEKFFVLDVDPRNGGTETLAALISEHGDLPTTVQAQTGGGGWHYLFKPIAGLGNGKLGPGLDIKSTGGQIVVAPSVTTAPYRWVHAPWNTELAKAPEWLVAKLYTRGAANSTGQIPDSTERGYFPPATSEVIQQAREALSKHGPSVDGQSGGLHAVQAAAILTHDFALTDEEAWPLFLEWNEGNQPPWDPSDPDLRDRLRKGRLYGKAAYGCRRTLDSLTTLRKWIMEWDGKEETIPALLERARSLTFADDATRAIAERELRGATGMTPKTIRLPRVVRPTAPTKPGEILVTTKIHEVADESLKAIAPHVFARNGVICQVVKAERTFISDLEVPAIQDLMSRHAVFVRDDEEGRKTQAAPATVAGIIHARRLHPGVRVIEAVTNAPIMLPDGEILRERGYNEQARVYLEPNVEVQVADWPELEDARAAVAKLTDVVCDYKFHSPADLSSWVAALLSPLVKAATGNAPTPLVCVSASSPGAGKTLLTEVIARIVTGVGAEVRPYNPKDPSEWGKRLTAFVKAGAPVSVFDNCNGPIGDEGLDRLVTSSTWSDRLLGASDAPPLPNVTTWLATGNNIEPVGDTVRRVLMVRIEVETERPQERTGFKYPLLTEHVLEHRAGLLSAALTILRAFHVAGRPNMKLPAWGSFVAWSDIVRNALVWAGMADPFETQRRASAELNEPDEQAHDFWLSVVADSDGTPANIAVIANSLDAQGTLNLRDHVTPHFLRKLVTRFIDKPRGGKRLRRQGGSYFVEVIT
jgi:hypothetical protein